jgi:WYL domain-containing protein
LSWYRLKRLFFIAVGIAVIWIGHTDSPILVCKDGWPSPSIGIQGACSHHGGVDRASEASSNLRNALTLLIGVVIIFRQVTSTGPGEPTGSAAEPQTLVEKIEAAIAERREIEFDYRGYPDEVPTHCRVRPISLSHVAHPLLNPQLVARGLLRNERCEFALDRISGLRILDSKA